MPVRYFVNESPRSFSHFFKIDEDCLVAVETLIDIIEKDEDVVKHEPFFVYGDVAVHRQ